MNNAATGHTRGYALFFRDIVGAAPYMEKITLRMYFEILKIYVIIEVSKLLYKRDLNFTKEVVQ